MEEETVTITKEEYDRLIQESLFLECLRCAGVDNWDGYSEAWKDFDKIKGGG